jgi:hypothetical protein
MGGAVSNLVEEVGQAGQGIISGVDEGLTSLDDEVLNTDLGKAALLAAGAYYGAPYLMGTEGAALSGANAAVAADNAYLAAQALTPAQAAAAAASSVEASQLAGLTGSTTTPSIYDQVISQLNQYPTTLPPTTTPTVTPPVTPPVTPSAIPSAIPSVIPSAVTTAGEMTAQQTAEMIAKEQAGSTGLLGSVGSALGNLSTAQQIGLGAAALGATGALGGSTPSSSTATTSIDPDVKAAYLRNLEEARATAAGLGTRQFAPMTEYNLGMVQRYMNPYEQEVIQGTLGDIERARQGQISAEGARATAARAFGGTRQAVTRSLVDEAALRNAGNLAAQLRQGGFTQAQNLGLSQEDLRRQLEQQRLDAARGLGVERLNVAQGALSLQPARIGESTTKPIYTNPVASGFGGALGGAQLGSLIGGKESGSEYAAYGAGLGGLLGFLG